MLDGIWNQLICTKKKSIKGNWNFALTLKAMDSKDIKVNGISEKKV